jgi:hypothetical protein
MLRLRIRMNALNTLNRAGIEDLQTTDPLQARRLEQELAARGVSYMTQIVKTKREGLRYVIKLLSPVHAGE